MSSTGKEVEESFATVLAVEESGVAFYERANAITADPRVKLIFNRLARQKQDHVKLLRDRAASLGIRGGRPAPLPSFYPVDAFAKVECYVCGYVSVEIPDACPKCGAARYAFEKEVSKATAWELAATTARASLALVRSLGEKHPAAKPLLEPLRGAEEALVREAESALAQPKS